MHLVSIFTFVAILYLVPSSRAACDVKGGGVTEDEKNQILKLHNDFRKKIANGQVKDQPRGINLKRVSWNACLGSEADSAAQQCEPEQRKISCNAFSKPGQLYYTSEASSESDNKADWSEAINSWISEMSNYTYGKYNKKTMDYVQIVWAPLKDIGCSYVFYQQSGKYHKIYACNYGQGAEKGGKPYATGDSGCEDLC
ncbi:unnamed protein product [Brassicogethes aeneus]|uniref:SCP domain-containing protein n=1 Tax=Brassicogethes aeneus TaxID=1431903 RepID=A0A9P0BB47_BRAAE|nr:unnamed protein product [Brassicogethes aeneus]